MPLHSRNCNYRMSGNLAYVKVYNEHEILVAVVQEPTTGNWFARGFARLFGRPVPTNRHELQVMCDTANAGSGELGAFLPGAFPGTVFHYDSRRDWAWPNDPNVVEEPVTHGNPL